MLTTCSLLACLLRAGYCVLATDLLLLLPCEVRGYELLPGLHAAALDAHRHVMTDGVIEGAIEGVAGAAVVGKCAAGSPMSPPPPPPPPPCAPVAFVRGDFLEADWSDASL